MPFTCWWNLAWMVPARFIWGETERYPPAIMSLWVIQNPKQVVSKLRQLKLLLTSSEDYGRPPSPSTAMFSHLAQFLNQRLDFLVVSELKPICLYSKWTPDYEDLILCLLGNISSPIVTPFLKPHSSSLPLPLFILGGLVKEEKQREWREQVW